MVCTPDSVWNNIRLRKPVNDPLGDGEVNVDFGPDRRLSYVTGGPS